MLRNFSISAFRRFGPDAVLALLAELNREHEHVGGQA